MEPSKISKEYAEAAEQFEREKIARNRLRVASWKQNVVASNEEYLRKKKQEGTP